MVNQSELTILVRHKKMGEESLNRFKEEVRKFAVDHTFKVMLALYQLNYSNVVFLLVIRRQQRSLESITQRSQDGSRSQRRRTNVQTLETSTGRKVLEICQTKIFFVNFPEKYLSHFARKVFESFESSFSKKYLSQLSWKKIFESSFSEKYLIHSQNISGDDKFIYWLRDCREAGIQVTLGQVKAKVGEILSDHGQQDVEKTCKWFLLWHNR